MNFTDLTRRIKFRLDDLVDTLEKRKMGVANNGIGELAYTFRQRADDVMREGEQYAILLRIIRAHENVCLMSLEEESLDEAWWDEKAEHLTTWIAQDCLRTIVRGVSTSSNPIYILEEMMKVEAAKRIFGDFVSGYIESFFDGPVLKDIFAGIKRRNEEEEARRAKTVHAVVYYKVGNTYALEARNHKDDFLERKYTDATRKPKAVEAAAQWAEEIRSERSSETGWSNPAIVVKEA